ncbi:MAG: hypothetical protein J5594_02145 [Elusimicrobiaceae bacterium]|nr:hypothetical protein [Elusimicrobiaceae bacterium]
MKNCFYKHIYKILVLLLFSAMAMPLFAANFGEHRRVILPQDINAVYKDLLVGEMNLNTQNNRVFLLELGKRPSYFWNTAYMFHLLQNQTLNINNITTLNATPNSQIFEIDNINVNRGSFLSSGLSISHDWGTTDADYIVVNPNVSVQNTSTLLLDYADPLNAYINSNISVLNYDIYARSIELAYGTGEGIEGSKYFRDAQLITSGGNEIVKFVSPRMMIYQHGGGSDFRAEGTALRFETPSISRTTNPKHYYGPWELANEGRVYADTETTNICLNDTNIGNQCIGDAYDHVFECSNGSSSNSCYDFQIEYIRSHFQNDMINNNSGSYAFKVQEVYQVTKRDSSNKILEIEMISQNPKVRFKHVSGETTNIPIATVEDGNFILENVNDDDVTISQSFYVDGTQLMVKTGNISFKPESSSEIFDCFVKCQGKLCSKAQLSIRYSVRELANGANSVASTWPDGEGHKQDLIIMTHTIDHCPSKYNNNYGDYEQNFKPDTPYVQLIDGLKILPSGSDWSNAKDPKVCMKRKVRCNVSGLEQHHFKRTYKPVTTNR